MLARAALLLATGALLPACVTQDIQFDPPRNYPPSIESAPTAQRPINQVVFLDRLSSDDDAGTAASFELEVVVRDANVDETLRYKVFVNFETSNPTMPTMVTEGMIPPSTSGDSLMRSLSVPLPLVFFPPGRACHRVELFVAGNRGFANAPFNRTPTEAGDLATATWWVARDSAALLSDCPR